MRKERIEKLTMGRPRLSVALLFLFVSTAVCSLTIVDEPGFFVITANEIVCPLLKCSVDVDVPYSHPPLVSWSKATTYNDTAAEKGSYLSISDLYWSDRALFIEPRCRPTSIAGRYDCGLELPYCKNDNYFGWYQCRVYDVANRNADVRTVHFVYILQDAAGHFFMPEAFNLRAELVESANGNLSVILRWNVTEKPSNLVYYKKARLWKVRKLTYNSAEGVYDHMVVTTEEVPFQAKATKVEQRETFFEFTEGIDRSTYYLYQVHNEGFKTDQDDNPHKSGFFSSYVYYYGHQVEAHIKTPDQVITLKYGESTKIECSAVGTPLPTVNFLRDSTIQEGLQNDVGDTEAYRSHMILSATYSDAGRYLCYASNIIVNPPKGRIKAKSIVEIDVIVVDKVPGSNGPETYMDCLPYDDAMCNSFITSDKILTNNSNGYTEQTVRDSFHVIESLVDQSGNRELFSSCIDTAKSIICHSVFPYCDRSALRQGMAAARNVCRHSCELFKEGGECWGLLQPSTEVYEVLMSNCDTRKYPGGASPECIHVALDSPGIGTQEHVNNTGNCSRGNGRGYRGDLSVTISGAQCQDWKLQSPHVHPMTPMVFPVELEGAEHACRNPGGVGQRPWCYTANGPRRWDYCDVPKCGECELYNESFCRNVPGFHSIPISLEWHRMQGNQHEIDRYIIGFNQQVSDIFEKQQKHELTPGCKNALILFLCHTAFPFCSKTGMRQIPCSDYCELLDDTHTCPGLQELISQTNTYSLSPLVELKCEMQEEGPKDVCLPPPGRVTAPPGVAETVTPSSLITENCYHDSGQTYRGNMSVTDSGLPCQNWNSVTPHNHTMTAEKYPELVGAGHHCRNPGDLGLRPWCFTTDPKVPWEYCNISACGASTPPSVSNTTIPPESVNDTTTETLLGIFMALITLVLLIVVVSICLCYCCYRNNHNRKNSELPQHLSRGSHSLAKYGSEMKNLVDNPQYVVMTPQLSSIVETFPRYDRSQIKYMKQLGQGNFGVVFQGKATGILEEDKEMTVAVKTLKAESSSEALMNFVHEAKLMFSFDHQNIIKIYGVCMSDLPYYMVLEFMDKGDLTQFLRGSASSAVRRLMNPFELRSRTESTLSDDPASLSDDQLVDICKQVAAGMEYLADKNHVHRDLACRNCLVKSDDSGSGLLIKIGDFGMSHNLYAREYYRVNGQAVLPVRWMSPEAVIYGKFSTAGDVWSFGVVMWEVFTFAMQPYYGISNEAVTEAIRRGKKLHEPPRCPPKIYAIMKCCWNQEASLRPSFAELHKMLRDFRVSESSIEDDQVSRYSDVSSDAFYGEENSIDGLSITESDIQ